MKQQTFSEITEVIEEKGYRFFTKGYYNLNLIGVRSSESKSDAFDDLYHLIFRAEDNHFKHYVFPFTSDPGKHWLLNPLNSGGTAIVVPNQYLGVYKLGIHGRTWASGGYPALEQVKEMEYVRDNNKDSILDFDLYRDPAKRKKYAFWANLKSNTHRASKWKKVLNVGKYSAACQVIQDPNHFERTLIPILKKSIGIWGNSFSYTLLESKDFR